MENIFKIALLCVGKWEDKYLDEFVKYYQNLGFTNIFFGDNNDVNDNSQLNVLQKYIDTGFVKYFNYQSILNIQHIFYDDIYFLEKNNYDWYFVCDIDEYLQLDKKYKTINDFLNDPDYINCDCIKFKWQTMVTNDINYIYHYVDKPIQERFKIKYNFPTFGVKSLFKYSKYINRVSLHMPIYDNDFIYNAILADSLTPIENYCSETSETLENIKSNNILLHYRYKSCDEYIDKLVKGNASVTDKDKNYNFKRYTVTYFVTYFCSTLDNSNELSDELKINIKNYFIKHLVKKLEELNIKYTL